MRGGGEEEDRSVVMSVQRVGSSIIFSDQNVRNAVTNIVRSAR